VEETGIDLLEYKILHGKQELLLVAVECDLCGGGGGLNDDLIEIGGHLLLAETQLQLIHIPLALDDHQPVLHLAEGLYLSPELP
jgi:hypothetical protein